MSNTPFMGGNLDFFCVTIFFFLNPLFFYALLMGSEPRLLYDHVKVPFTTSKL